MVSGRMMMIRTCLSLIIATVTKDLVTTQVLRHVVGLCFRPTFLLQTSEKRIFRSLRLAGTAKGFVHRAIVVSARQHSPTDPGQLVGGRYDHDIAGCSGFEAAHPPPQARSFAFDAQHRGPFTMAVPRTALRSRTGALST